MGTFAMCLTRGSFFGHSAFCTPKPSPLHAKAESSALPSFTAMIESSGVKSQIVKPVSQSVGGTRGSALFTWGVS